MAREQPGLKLGYFPPGQVVVEPVEERGIDHRGRQVGEQVRYPDELGVRFGGVADQDDRCLGGGFLFAASERAGFHVVLEHVDDCGLRHLQTCYLVERDNVPGAQKPDPVGGHVDEQLSDCDPAAGYQDGVWVGFPVDETLAGTPRAEFDQVVVALGHRDQPEHRQELGSEAETCWFKPHRPHDQVKPAIPADPAAGRA
jgi:hypothetical protein